MRENMSLVQRRIGGKTVFTLDGTRRLLVERRGILQTFDTPIALELIDPDPVTYKHIPGFPLVLSVLFVLIVVALGVHSAFEVGEKAAAGQRGLAVAFSVLAASAIAFLYQGYANVFILKNINTGATVAAISISKPNSDEVLRFLAELSERIRAIRYPETMPLERRIEIYRRHLDFLLEEAVLSRDMYLKATAGLEERLKGADVIRIIQ